MMATRESITLHVRAGVFLVALLVLGVGGWAAATEISGAVIGSGVVVVDSNIKKVQHPTGGVVGEILVRDGDRVEAGDIVLRLDATLTRANLAIVDKGLLELQARKSRLEAERDNAQALNFPHDLLARQGELDVAHVLSGERRLFDLRRFARAGQKEQLGQRIAQLQEEVGGHLAQAAAKASEIVLVGRELKGARELWDKNLMPITKLTALEREATRLEGERAQLVAVMAQARGKIAETELQVLQIDRDLGTEVAKELREIDGKIGEFVERRVAAEDALKRIDIRAPQAGFVHQSIAHTVGGVVSAGEAIMLVVPEADNLLIEARIAPQDIDQLRVGQAAVLRFSAFNQRTTPEINGSITRVSADAVTDSRSGLTYYAARVGLPPEEKARLGAVTLVPGMPVEVFIQTGDRSALSFLVKPLSDQFARAFRER